MQRLPENFSVLNDRLERPAPNNSVEGDEIVHSSQKWPGRVNPLVPGSSPGGPTINRRTPAVFWQSAKDQSAIVAGH